MSNRDEHKILIVDDDSFIRSTIRAVLRAIGRFNVQEAEDGDAGLVSVDSFRPDVVLCDVNMPHMGGLQFVALLRAHPDTMIRATPVVMLTAHAEQATVADAARLKISGYLIKPVSPQRLGALLAKILRRQTALPAS
jgi:two-component system chemotaxis response regulator CheY